MQQLLKQHRTSSKFIEQCNCQKQHPVGNRARLPGLPLQYSPLPRQPQVHCNVQQQAQMTTTPPAADTLWARIQQAYKRAQGKGAIYQIHSKPEKLPDEVLGLDFVLHVADALNDKPKPIPTREGGPVDAFETLDEDLTVDDQFSDTHMLRLNKFNVVPYHSLVITRAAESQQASLSLEDWESTLATMQYILEFAKKCWQAIECWMPTLAVNRGALAYFNSGAAAGASQPRKHLQVLPTHWGGFPTVPMPFQPAAEAAWEEEGRPHIQALALRRLPFQSFAAVLPDSRHVPFNVLATERLMMVVPRSRERCGPVSCNAVVFAGTLLVRSTAELEFVRSKGPLKILQEVTLPWDTEW